jgi:hypothetical protein
MLSEWIGGAVVQYISANLIGKYGSDAEVTSLLDELEYIIVPVVNPGNFFSFSCSPCFAFLAQSTCSNPFFATCWVDDQTVTSTPGPPTASGARTVPSSLARFRVSSQYILFLTLIIRVFGGSNLNAILSSLFIHVDVLQP